MNKPGGNHNRATAATGGFPWAARTVASVDSDARSKARDKEYYARHVLRQIEAEEAAKAQCRACLKPLVANCPYWACPQKWPKITDNIPHNLTYRDTAIPTLFPSRRSGDAVSHGVPTIFECSPRELRGPTAAAAPRPALRESVNGVLGVSRADPRLFITAPKDRNAAPIINEGRN